MHTRTITIAVVALSVLLCSPQFSDILHAMIRKALTFLSLIFAFGVGAQRNSSGILEVDLLQQPYPYYFHLKMKRIAQAYFRCRHVKASPWKKPPSISYLAT